MNVDAEILFELIRISLGNNSYFSVPKQCDWQSVFELSVEQNVTALSFGGLMKLDNVEIEDEIRYKWLGYGLVLEKKNNQRLCVARDLANFWNQVGLDVFLLKGFSIAQFYPNMFYRESVDIDIYLCKRDASDKNDGWKLGNKVIENMGIKVNKRDFRHSIFTWDGVKIENHRICASSVRGKRRLKKLDDYLKELLMGLDKIDYQYIDGTCTISPPPLFNVIFFIQHAYSHFMNEGLTLKNICDWGVLVKTYYYNGDSFWHNYNNVCKEYGFLNFSDSLSRIIYLVCGVKAPWFLSPPDLQPHDYLLLSDCFKKPVVKVTFKNSNLTHIQQAINKVGGFWKYKYYSDYSLIADVFLSFWGTIVDKNKE